jgi:signal transduction histidine kinase
MAAHVNSPQETNEQLQQQVRLLKEQLARTQSLATIGELTSTTTHEFNNVLMTILNYAKMGIRHEDTPTRDKALRKILEAAERAAKVTRVILGAAGNRRNEYTAVDLASLARDTLVLLEREMNKYRVMVETLFDEVPPARADGNAIQRVMINLLTNARQAMPNGGTLTMALKHEKKSGSVVLTVRDSGVGIPAESLPRIFEPFYSTKSGPDESGKGGTGLGLSSCRDIIISHGGKIRVESTVGRGTAFIIRLPVAGDNMVAA